VAARTPRPWVPREQSVQLTEVRAEYEWLATGSQTVQQQALRDFAPGDAELF
jgi:putative transposase